MPNATVGGLARLLLTGRADNQPATDSVLQDVHGTRHHGTGCLADGDDGALASPGAGLQVLCDTAPAMHRLQGLPEQRFDQRPGVPDLTHRHRHTIG